MKQIAIVTDSNSGLTQKQGETLGISVLPMPFYINGELFYEGITLSQEEFYQKLSEDADISTSQPSPADVTALWDKLLEEYKEIVDTYRTEGWGIYDDTAELDRAIALSDAYYGDKSSVVQLFQKMEMPVMIQRIEVTDRDYHNIKI